MTLSMVLNAEAIKHSVYCCILMDSNHSAILRKGIPSDPLVLGNRMEILRREGGVTGQRALCQSKE